jgi:hypothetical protein
MPLPRSNTFNSNSVDEVHAFMSHTFCAHQLNPEGAPPMAFRHN